MANPTVLNIAKDLNGALTYGIEFTNISYSISLTTLAEETLTVPENTDYAIFNYSAGSNVMVGNNISVTIPPSSFVESVGELLPRLRTVKAGDILHFMSDSPALLNVLFYRRSINGG